MTIRRIAATAVAAAVTTPVVLLSVSPVYADAKPVTAQTGQQRDGKTSVEDLRKAAAAAQEKYDEAVAAEKAAVNAVEAAMADDAPHSVAAAKARKEAAAAAAAKATADKERDEAKAARAALPETATADEKAEADKKLAAAEAAATAAEARKTAADAEAAKAGKAADDIVVDAGRKLAAARKAVDIALAEKRAADEALADAEKRVCVYEGKLTTTLTGLPTEIVAGSTVDFTVRVTNGTAKTMDKVLPSVFFHGTDKSGTKTVDDLFGVQWSTAASPAWKHVAKDHFLGSVTPLKKGAHADIKVRLTVDAKAPAGNGTALVSGQYVNNDGTCGGNIALWHDFTTLPAGSKPATSGTVTPSKTTPGTSGTTPQGSTSSQAVGATTSSTSTTPSGSTGSLASTGSSSALPLAGAAGAAVVLGAGTVVLTRRRKAGASS
ncbi:LPXTG cell wall anchor domain-containing protein [Streptomyces sp. NPDC059175]|uniref:LPXTG cell wall anchor domain-containing protein n=1 Tax=Streptomyces sp. NPDC059175 TaxID=3346757 RepID=UPI0036842C3C